VLNRQGSGNYSAIIAGIDHASDPELGAAKVISMSLGGSADVIELHAACDRAVARGVVVCAAAGNDGANVLSYPGGYDSVICVASTTSADGWSTFSTYGPQVDVAAPGSSIYSTYRMSNGKPGYATLSGTSMATPHVAGTAALLIGSGLLQDRNGDTFINDEVRARIEGTCVDLGAAGRDDKFGNGRISASAAIAAGAN